MGNIGFRYDVSHFFFVSKAIFIMQSHDFFRFMPKKLTGTVAQFLRRIFIIFNGTFFTFKEKKSWHINIRCFTNSIRLNDMIMTLKSSKRDSLSG